MISIKMYHGKWIETARSLIQPLLWPEKPFFLFFRPEIKILRINCIWQDILEWGYIWQVEV